MNDTADRLLHAHAKNVAVLAETQGAAGIGKQVLDLLCRREPVTFETLCASLHAVIDGSPSALGKIKPEYDVCRAQAEAALRMMYEAAAKDD